MRSITISDNDASVLKEFYEAELTKAKRRVTDIEQVLAQITGRRKPGRPKGYSPKTLTRKRRPGRPKGSKTKRRGPGRPKGSKNKKRGRGRPKRVVSPSVQS